MNFFPYDSTAAVGELKKQSSVPYMMDLSTSSLSSITNWSVCISQWCFLFDIHSYVIRAFSCASQRVILLAAGLQELKCSSVSRLLATSEALKPLAATRALEEAAPCRLRNLPGSRGRSRRLGWRALSDDWCIIQRFLDSRPASLNPAEPHFMQQCLNRLNWPCFA